jgi:hypothetical protein
MLRRVALVRTDVSDEYIASIFRVERISELSFPPKRRFCQDPQGATSQKTALFQLLLRYTNAEITEANVD